MLALCLGMTGCALQHYQPQPLAPADEARQFGQRRLDDPDLTAFVQALDVPFARWPPPRWNADALFAAALYLQPDLQVARSEWRVRVAEAKAAGRRPPLVLSPELEHHSEPDGESPWTFGALFDVVIPGPGRRQARVDAARARAEAAGLELGNKAWALRRRIYDAIITLFERRRQVVLAGAARVQAEQALHLLERRQQVGVVGSPQVTPMRLRLQQARLAAARAASDLAAARLDLAGAIGVSPEAIAAIADRLAAPASALPATAGADPAYLRERALKQRYDVRGALAGYAEADADLRTAIAAQYPDITLSPGFLFDQADQVWVLDASLPLLLAGHNAGPIAAARAARDAAAARFRAVQAGAIGAVAHARGEYEGRLQVLATAGDILDAERRHEREVAHRLDAGYADRLERVNAHVETVAARQARTAAEADARRAHAALESALQAALADNARAGGVIDRFVALGAGALVDTANDEEATRP